MNTTTKDHNNIKIVYFEGELDSNSALEAETLLTELREQGHHKILVTFEKLAFISSAGLRIILATSQNLKKIGGELRICDLNETIQEVFDVSGFSTLLNVYEDEAAALDRF
ncbi:MAG: STAS domain-containing protein [SAR324 cluster bacterium]|nr:STAS domain-containing protein [SAR324 cluster bacterium]